MLMKCPECELQVSDKAFACPHCGYPIQTNAVRKSVRRTNKRKRLPNGFGQISEIKGRNLRKPFRALVSVGKTPEGRPIVKPLKPESYFETYNDAYAALIEYNKSPYELEDAISVEQLYEKWSEQYFETLKSKSSTRTITAAWAYCTSVYRMRACDLRARHIKGCMDEGVVIQNGEKKYASAGTKSRIKSLFNLMLDYALEYEIVEKNYARTFKLSDDIIEERETAKRGHIPFTDEEIDVLWKNINTIPYTDVVLFQIYSGWRPQELGLIELVNVDLDNWTIVGGMKTDAGTNRTVPVHSKIRDIVRNKYNEALELGSKYLINCADTKTHTGSLKFTYDKYKTRFANVRDALGLNESHRPHDPRIHFVTMAKRYGMDEYAIKYIVGHKISDITEKTYTKRNIEWLKEEMEKLK